MTTRKNTHHIVVLGAGYAGLATATNLAGRTRRRDDIRITLISAHDTFVEKLRLHQLGTGQQLDDLSIPDLLDGTGVTFVQGWVRNVEADANTVELSEGSSASTTSISYDTLVYGLGGIADSAPVPGVDDYAHRLDSPKDARALADRLAAPTTRSVAVVGTGLTGVEVAAEIADSHPYLEVTLLGRDTPGAQMAPHAQRYLLQALDRLNVDVRDGVEASKVLTDSVELVGGENVAADVVVWASGVHVSPMAAAAGFDVDERGRILTDTALRSVSHQNVYAVGDAAAVRQKFGVLHGTCQSGMPTGVHVATSIVRQRKGKQPNPFRFGYYHAPVSLGRSDAIVQFTKPDDAPRRWFLTGKRAAWYKETVSSSPWPTYRRMTKYPRSGAIWPQGGSYTRGGAA